MPERASFAYRAASCREKPNTLESSPIDMPASSPAAKTKSRVSCRAFSTALSASFIDCLVFAGDAAIKADATSAPWLAFLSARLTETSVARVAFRRSTKVSSKRSVRRMASSRFVDMARFYQDRRSARGFSALDGVLQH